MFRMNVATRQTLMGYCATWSFVPKFDEGGEGKVFQSNSTKALSFTISLVTQTHDEAEIFCNVYSEVQVCKLCKRFQPHHESESRGLYYYRKTQRLG